MLSAATTLGHESIFASAANRSVWPLTRRTELALAVAAVAVQIAILVDMIVLDGLPLLLGERIKLPVVPVDPHDFFRGDYVVLSYDFNQFDPAQVDGMPALAQHDAYDHAWDGRDIYVALKPVGDHYEAASRSTQRPTSGPYLRGRVQTTWRRNLTFGIEAYYVKEGEGKRLENLIRDKKILAEVAVWQGQAKLVRLVE